MSAIDRRGDGMDRRIDQLDIRLTKIETNGNWVKKLLWVILVAVVGSGIINFGGIK